MKVLTFGTFDKLHPGHLALLNEANAKGDLFIVVARDQNIEQIKGRKPDQTEEDRIAAIKEALPDTTVLLGDAENYLQPVEDLQPDLIVMGYDQNLPPGVSEEDISCKVVRAAPFKPEEHKSSIHRENG